MNNVLAGIARAGLKDAELSAVTGWPEHAPLPRTDALRVVFVLKDGTVFEHMENSGPGNWFKS